jgi:predicted ATPase
MAAKDYMTDLAIKSFRVKNFKAILDSGTVEFSPLTVLIGNNGSGKSSFIEGLETYQMIIKQGLDIAMNRWRGFEHVRNRINPHEISGNSAYETNPMEFEQCRKIKTTTFRSTMTVTIGKESELLIQSEKLFFGKKIVERNAQGIIDFPEIQSVQLGSPPGVSILSKTLSSMWSTVLPHNLPNQQTSPKRLKKWLENLNSNSLFWESFDWQFMTMNPDIMGTPIPQKRTGGEIQLNKDGSNIAEYLSSIRNLSQSAFDDILETLQYVLPYAKDLQAVVTEELERAVYLQLTERECKIAGWLLSTGTLRIVALLALLRHPKPPPLIVIEEIENGLDLRTIYLIVEEIRKAVESGKSQIIVTTHSPYFLDLLRLEHIVLVERDKTGQPIFTRPADQNELENWAERFTPGELYTMGRLRRKR